VNKRLEGVILVVKDDPETRRVQRLPRIHGTWLRRDWDGTIWGARWRDLTHEQFRALLTEEDGWRLIFPGYLRGEKQKREYLLDPPASRRRVSILTCYEVAEGVEAAIRLAQGHVASKYVPEVGDEARQMEAVIALAQELSATFLDYGSVTEEVVEEVRAKTAELIRRLGLERAKLPEKQVMTVRMAKGATLRDSLGRKNLLISLTRLYSTYLGAVRRLESFGVYTSKYEREAHMLLFERGKMRWALRWTVGELQRRVLAHVNFRDPQAKVWRGTAQPLAKMIEGIARGPLSLVQLKPYFPVAKEARESLFEAARLVRREDFAGARDIVEGVVGDLDEVLLNYEEIGLAEAA